MAATEPANVRLLTTPGTQFRPASEPSRVPATPLRIQELDPRSEAILLALFDAVGCGILLFGPAGELWAVNDRCAEILCAEPQALHERADFQGVVAGLSPQLADPDSVAARWRARMQSGEPGWDEFELARPERRIIERFSRPVRDRLGRPFGRLEVYRDVTSQRLSESRMFHTERVAALGQLVSGIAHELNNPLTSILGYAQLLLRHTAGSQGNEDADRILQEAERASRIARNLLLFAREAKIERTAVDLNEIVERTVALRSYQLRLENIRAEMHLDPSLPRTLADSTQVQQVLLNLIVNAEQAIQQSGGAGHIWVGTRGACSGRVALEVADDGPGVPPEIAPRIFDPFFTTKPPGVGTGLGLSVLYSIVQQHGGRVSVSDRSGGGALFTVELPAAPGEAATGFHPPAKSRSGLKGDVADGLRREVQRILVVEDEPTVARLIADVLGEEGHTVDRVLDSREGLELIRHHDYGLVVCDLRMPHLDGRSFYRELVRRGSPLRRRLVFVTGDTLAPRTVEFLEQSGLPYLAKPFLVEELREIVHGALAAAAEQEAS